MNEKFPQIGNGKRYTIETCLGTGGMGTVFRATDEELKRKVAIKVLHDHFVQNPEARARLDREVSVLASLRHPQLVNIYQADLDVTPPYYVMEFLTGSPLSKLIPEGPMPKESVKILFECLADALQYLHEQRILHRDITPDNVFIEPDGNVRLVDFGLVRPVDWTPLTAEGAMLGTLRFTPPEVLRGEEFTTRGDIFQAGLIVYYAAKGVHPYEREGKKGKELIRSLAAGELSPVVCEPEVFGDYGEILCRCCSLTPEFRPEDGKELFAELDKKNAPGFMTSAIRPVQVSMSSSVSKIPPVKNNEKSYGLLAIIVLLGVILGSYIAKSSEEVRPVFDVYMLSTKERPGGFTVEWQSRRPYRTWVQVKGAERPLTFAGPQPKKAVKSHHVEVSGLEDEKLYGVKIVFPNGKTTRPRRVKTGKFKLDLLAARFESDKRVLQLSWKANGKGPAKVKAHSLTKGEVIARATEGADGLMTARFDELPADIRSLNVETTLNNKSERTYSLVKELRKTIKGLTPKLKSFDGRWLTKDVNVLLLQSLTSMAGEIGSHDRGVKEIRQEERKRIRKKRDEVRAIVYQRMKERDYLHIANRAAKASALVFCGKLLPAKEQQAFYEAIHPWLIVKSFLVFQRIDIDEFPRFSLGPFGLYGNSTLRGPAQELNIIGEGGKYKGPIKLDGTLHGRTFSFSFPIKDVQSLSGAELRFSLSLCGEAATHILVNKNKSLLFVPRPLLERKSEFKAVQALPLHFLKDGNNEVKLRYDGLLGRVTAPKYFNGMSELKVAFTKK